MHQFKICFIHSPPLNLKPNSQIIIFRMENENKKSSLLDYTVPLYVLVIILLLMGLMMAYVTLKS